MAASTRSTTSPRRPYRARPGASAGRSRPRPGGTRRAGRPRPCWPRSPPSRPPSASPSWPPSRPRSAGPVRQRGLRHRPLGEQRVLHAVGPGQCPRRQQQRRRALGPRRVGHLDRGSGPQPAPEDPRIHRGAVEQSADGMGLVAGEIQPRAAVRDGGRRGRRGHADDPAVDVGGSAFLHHQRDLTGGRRGDRVRVDEEPAEALHGPGHVQRSMRGADREDDVGPVGNLGRRPRVGQPGGPRPGRRLRPPALGRPQHLIPGAGQASPHSRAHLARMKQPDHWSARHVHG